jgi:hypothetical protein
VDEEAEEEEGVETKSGMVGEDKEIRDGSEVDEFDSTDAVEEEGITELRPEAAAASVEEVVAGWGVDGAGGCNSISVRTRGERAMRSVTWQCVNKSTSAGGREACGDPWSGAEGRTDDDDVSGGE